MRKARVAIIAISLFLFQSGVVRAVPAVFDGDIQIISSDEHGITFIYSAPGADLRTPEGFPEDQKFPFMPRTAQDGVPGTPFLPVKIVPIGVPYSAKPAISVVSESYEPLAHVKVPTYVSEKSEAEFAAKASIASTEINWPPRSASIGRDQIIRGLRVIRLSLAAAKIQNGTLYKAVSLTIRVDFNSPDGAGSYYPRPMGAVFDRVMRQTVANYDIAQNWRVHWPPIPLKTSAAQSPFDSSQAWVKLEITNSGLYRINRFDLSTAGLDVNEIDPREFRIFYGGGAELKVDNDLPRPDLVEIPILVTGADDGAFDHQDLIVFSGESLDRYEYNSALGEFVHQLHHFAARNVYWLAVGGDFADSPRRWATIDGSVGGPYDFAADKFRDAFHLEREAVLFRDPNSSSGEYRDYYQWYWDNRVDFSASFQLSDVVAQTEAAIKVKTNINFSQLLVNNVAATRISYSGGISRWSTTNLISGTSFNLLFLNNPDEFFLDYVDIFYTRWLTTHDGYLAFHGPDTSGLVEYRISNVPSDYVLMDITSPDSVSQVVNGQFSDGELRFHGINDRKRQYLLVSPALYKTVSRFSLYEPEDLRAVTNSADYIIVTHENFYDQALELATHREAVSPGMVTRVVKIADIYNQFSWGLSDPTAIRDFLKYAYENWSGNPPSYVLLVGDGHYDYRNNLGSGAHTYLPPFEALTPTGLSSEASDENFIYFGEYGYLDSDNNESLDMIIGRLAVNDTDEMQIVLEKIRNYEANPNMGKWRNTVVVAADDNLTNLSKTETMHTNQGETLSNNHVPASMDIQKIYLVEYPVRAGRSKPDAREALIRAFNEGCLIVDWIGHGSKGLWAHEFLFRRAEDIPRLQNLDKLPLVFAASCSIGFFDHPTEPGMSEDLVRYSGGGAIASIGATREVFSTPNAELNKDVFDELLYADSVSFAEALYIAKFLRQAPAPPSANDRKFNFFGDPAMVAGKPTLEARFSYFPDSLVGLTVDSIAGSIYSDDSAFQSNFNGTVWILVKDAQINRHRMLTDYNGNPTTNPPSYINYVLPGRTIFNGPAEVRNGSFLSSFFVPKDVSYGGSGARIYVYFENGQIDGAGVTDTLPIGGGISAEADSTGPTIEVFHRNESLAAGLTAVPMQATFEVRLFDPHGINITGSMGHGIMVQVDGGDTYSGDITDNFVFDMGSWQQGRATFELVSLSPGEHTMTLKAWDNYNNSSVFTGYIQVFESTQFAVEDVMNYPNPVVAADSTVFQYMLSNDAEVVTLKIFTLAGRKIRNIELDSPEYTAAGYRFYRYDLRDDDNDRLASGVYIYKIEAVGTGFDSARRKADFESKLVILR